MIENMIGMAVGLMVCVIAGRTCGVLIRITTFKLAWAYQEFVIIIQYLRLIVVRPKKEIE